MIFCNQCGGSLADNATLCHECGAQILQAPAPFIQESPAKVVNPAPAQPTAALPSPPPQGQVGASHRPPNVPIIITVTALATVLLVMLGVVSARFWMKNDKTVAEQKSAAMTGTNDARQVVETEPAQTPRAAPSPAAPTPAPSFNSLQLVQEVRAALQGWAAASRAHDLDAHMSYYAPTLDIYYRLNNVSADRVRSDRARAYDRYYRLDIQLGDIDVSFDSTGERATAVFDKSFNFEGDKYLSGKVREMVWLARFGRRWLITGEKDIQVYYVNK